MPNWCTNTFRVTGSKKQVESFKAEHFRQGEDTDELQFDFNTVIPMPDSVFKGNIGKAEEEKYGDNNWYNWSINNWGTKWNSCHNTGPKMRETKKGDTALTFMFDTAWSPPEPIFQALAKRYPDLFIEIHYIEEGMSFEGNITISGGMLTDDQVR